MRGEQGEFAFCLRELGVAPKFIDIYACISFGFTSRANVSINWKIKDRKHPLKLAVGLTHSETVFSQRWNE